MAEGIECGPLLTARLQWEAENPRPESLRRAEKMVVQALAASGFGRQYQVTRADGFEIAVDDLLIRVDLLPADDDELGSRTVRVETRERVER